MATEVFTTEKITLQDDTDVVLRPLVIGRLRKFMDIWNEWMDFVGEQEALPPSERAKDREVTNVQYDKFIAMAGIALEPQKKGELSSTEYRDYLEETLDEETIYKILEVCGNLKLNNPNLQAMMMQAAMEEEPETVLEDGEI